jgi:raffinose/stachyose/melibiose transport system permease protein
MLRTLFFAPYVLSEVVTGVVWRQILRPAGLLDQSLEAIGAGGLVHEWLADPDVVLYSLFFVISWKYFGFHMVLILAGLQQIPKELGEAAAIDGASSWQTFRHVTLPLLGPTIRVSVFLSIIGALQLFDIVWVTTKGGPIGASSTMATYLYENFRRGLFGYASAVSIVIFAIALVVALLYQRYALRRDLRGTGLVG